MAENVLVSDLFERMFQAEREENTPLVIEIRSQIERELFKSQSHEPIEDEVIETDLDFSLQRFLGEAKKKAFFVVFSKVWSGKEVSQLDLAKSLSSFITHSVIELHHQSGAYEGLRLRESSALLASYLSGEVSPVAIRSFISNELSFLR